jgi:kynurenine formamidase
MDELTEVHQFLFRCKLLIVVGLAGLDHLAREVVVFIALPLKVSGGDGSPIRAVAIEQSDGARESQSD